MRDGLDWDRNPVRDKSIDASIYYTTDADQGPATVKDGFWTKTKRGLAKATKM